MNQLIDNKIPAELLERGTKKTFFKDSNIFKISTHITNCYLILSGMAKIYIDHENGRRSILDFAQSNDWLGELSLFYNETDIKENKVLQEIQCLAYDINDLRQLCKENAEISYYFASYTANKLLDRSYRMSEYMNYSLEKRLASFILKHQYQGVYNIPHTDVSEYMNVSYRHVLHVIKNLSEQGVLTKEKGKGNGYVISDMDRLIQLKL
jgi:CRP-like cAMP-binding protein